jgi:hypothetical protein
MTRARAQDLTVDQLVERFVEIAVAQSVAKEYGDTAKYNRLFPQMQDVMRELKSRPGDQRRALLPLLAHPNAQVRLLAAFSVGKIAPEAARAALQLIWDRNEFPQAADAYGMLRSLEKGLLD